MNTTLVVDASQHTMDYKQALAEQLNDEMTKAVLPVTVFVGIEMVLGFFGNLLVLYVFLFRYHVCNFRYFVLCLAFVDITSSLTTMPGEIVTQLFWYVYPLPAICKVKSFFNVFTVSVEAFCLLTIAVDRYLKVCRPFGWQIKPNVAIILCGFIYFFSVVLAVPVSIFWGTHSYNNTYMNTSITITVCEKDEDYEHTNKPLHYSLSFEIIISLCLFAMFILYVLVARKLFQDKRNQNWGKTTKTATTSLSATYSGVPTDLSSDPSSNDVKDTRRDIKVNEKPSGRVASVSSDNCLTSGAEDSSFVSEIKKAKIKKLPYPILSDTEDDLDVNYEPHIQKKYDILTLNAEKNTSRTKPFKNQNRHTSRQGIPARVKRKTLIMFILTIVFILTTVLYMTLLSFIARSDDILQNMSNGGKALYFFFFRLYFINHVINPAVYGILDPRFRKVMSSFRRKNSGTNS